MPLCDLFVACANRAAAKGRIAQDVERLAAEFLVSALGKLEPQKARDKASEIWSDCAGAFVGETITLQNEAIFGHHQPPRHSEAVWRVTEKLLHMEG